MQAVCSNVPFPALLADPPRQLCRNEGPALGAHLAHHLDDRPVLLRTIQHVAEYSSPVGVVPSKTDIWCSMHVLLTKVLVAYGLGPRQYVSTVRSTCKGTKPA